jgi:hypothetical protein
MSIAFSCWWEKDAWWLGNVFKLSANLQQVLGNNVLIN